MGEGFSGGTGIVRSLKIPNTAPARKKTPIRKVFGFIERSACGKNQNYYKLQINEIQKPFSPEDA